MNRRRRLRRTVIAVQKATGVEAMMGGRDWGEKGREGGGGGVLVMGRAMRGVSRDMDMDIGKTEEKERGMHMRRCLGGKGPVVVAAMVAVGSEKGRRRREQGWDWWGRCRMAWAWE